MLEWAKGQRAVARALIALPTGDRPGLLSPLVTAVLGRPCPPPSSEMGQAEEALMTSLLAVVEGLPPVKEEGEKEGQGEENPEAALTVLTECVERVVRAFSYQPDPSKPGLRALLASRPRAQVMHAVLKRGESLAAPASGASERARSKWATLQGRFMELLSVG
jgi:hypothetical protein